MKPIRYFSLYEITNIDFTNKKQRKEILVEKLDEDIYSYLGEKIKLTSKVYHISLSKTFDKLNFFSELKITIRNELDLCLWI